MDKNQPLFDCNINMYNDLVSVIVPVYNAEKYIENCMISIANQNYKNLEVVLVDDGSSDNSISIAESVLCNYGIKHKIVYQENSGAASARNNGVRKSSGDWIMFVDADDTITKNHIDTLLLNAKNNNTDLVIGNFVYSNNYSAESEPVSDIAIYSQNDIIRLFLVRKINIVVTAILIRKNSFIECNLWFKEDVRFGEDAIFYWELLMSYDKFVYNNAATYFYNVHDGSVTTAPSIERMGTNIKAFSNLCLRISSQINSEFASFVYARQLFAMLRISAVHLDYKSYKSVYSYLNFDQQLCVLKRFPDRKVRILSHSLTVSKFPFYFINRIRKR